MGSPIGSAKGDAANRAGAFSAKLRQWLASHPRVSALADLTVNVLQAQAASRASLAAAGAAFWLVIALFPAVIAVVSIFGLLISPQDVANAISNLGDKGSGSLSTALSTQANAMSGSAATTLSIGLLVSLLVTLWSVSNGAYNMARAVRLAYGLPELGYAIARLRAYAGGVIAVLAIGLLAAGATRVTAISNSLSGTWQVVFSYLVEAPLSFAIVVVCMAGVYRFALQKASPGRILVPGAVVATLALAILVVLLTLAIAGFGSTSAVYGVAAGAVSALLAAYTAIYIVLIGATINAHWPTSSAFRLIAKETSPGAD